MTKYDPANTPFNLPPVRNINPAVSKQTMDVINRATQPDALARFQSVSDMKVKLTEKPKPAPQAAVPQPAPQHVVRRRRRGQQLHIRWRIHPRHTFDAAYGSGQAAAADATRSLCLGAAACLLVGYILTIIVVGGLAGLAALPLRKTSTTMSCNSV